MHPWERWRLSPRGENPVPAISMPDEILVISFGQNTEGEAYVVFGDKELI